MPEIVPFARRVIGLSRARVYRNEPRRGVLTRRVFSAPCADTHRVPCKTLTVLILEAPDEELASRFHGGDRSLARAQPVFERWSRAAELGVRPDTDAQPQITATSDLVMRRERLEEVFREKRSILGPLSQKLARDRLVAVIADPEGVIVAAHGGGSIDDVAARARIIEGARWSEDVRGTNAIGTAITERQAVAVIGAAHYEHRNQGIFCYGHPVIDGYGDLVAVVDVSGPIELNDPAIARAVHGAAVSVEQSLRRLAYAQSGAGTLSTIERLVHRSSACTLLVEASGKVGVVNDHAAETLGLDRNATITVERLFGMTFKELLRLVVTGLPDMRFETPGATYRVELDPINAAGGRTIAIVVNLEAVRTRTKRRSEPPAPPSRAHAAFDPILGSDTALVAAKVASSKFAQTNLPVLLLAETGTGKDLFARAIHDASPRAHGPYVALNCAALAASVLESELFGHAPSSFTGASRTGADGKIMAADGGTLFLDEIADMPDAQQSALLRVLDEGGAHFRVGDTRQRKSDFRLVCATSRDLPALVERGTFRRDLFFRIHGACVMLPAVRDRLDAIELAEGLLAQATPGGKLAASGRDWIAEHAWPGNVRELKSALVHAVAMAEGQPIEASHFPRALVGLAPPSPSSEPRTRVAIINDAILDAVKASAGNVSEAARRLGIARSTVYRVLRGRRSE